MYQSDLFQDQHVFVTGGRSGIGFGIAKLFLQLGASVTIASRKQQPLQAAAEELSQFGPCDAKACDIRQPEEIQSIAEYIADRHGKLDVLINNAGGQFPAPAEMISPNGWATVIDNNLNGTFYVSQQMTNTFFRNQQHGVIVNIIANMFRGFPGMAHTGAARAGVENLTKTLAQEWAEYKVRVTAVAPGTIASSGLDTYPEAIQAFFQAEEKKNLMGRFGSVEDVANAVIFLASPLAAYISGVTLYVDGMEHLAADRMSLFSAMKTLASR